jgi:GTP pyrophosphokinase
MKAQNVSFDEVYDKFALRIVYKSNPHEEKFVAWKIYSIVLITTGQVPVDYETGFSPKSTGYEALHITVMGPKGRWVEVQVRSERMDEIAEKGMQHITNIKWSYQESIRRLVKSIKRSARKLRV